jgi:hypothetical protein
MGRNPSTRYRARSFFEKPFPWLDAPQRRIMLVVAGGLIIVFFMNYFMPYEQRFEFNVSVSRYHWIISGYALPFIVVMILSQFGLRHIVCRYRYTLGWFGVLYLVEVLLLAIGFALWFCLNCGWYKLTLVKFLEEIPDAAMALILAYGIVIFSILLRKELVLLAPGAINSLSVGDENPMVVIHDENGRDTFGVALKRLLYLQAADNYVIVSFREGTARETHLVRTTLKKVEHELRHPSLLRCHRSYMVNLLNVGTVIRSGASLKLSIAELDNASIPVSKNYALHIINRLRTLDIGLKG